MSRPPWSTGQTPKRRIKPKDFFARLTVDRDIVFRHPTEAMVTDKAQEIADAKGVSVDVYANYGGGDDTELRNTLKPRVQETGPTAMQVKAGTMMRARRILNKVRGVDELAKELERLEAAAERAVWAMLQDDIVQLAMVSDLEAHVGHAVEIGFATKDNDEAIDMAQASK